MGIFEQLNQLLAEGDTANITVLKKGDKLITAIIVTNKERNHKWPPFTATGTATELEVEFYDSFDKACSIIKTGVQTIEQFERQVKESAKSSDAGKKIEAKVKANQNEAETKAKKEAEVVIKKAEEFFTKKEYAKSRYYYSQALDIYVKHKLDTKAIHSKIDECNKLDVPDLFGAPTAPVEDKTNSVSFTEEHSDKSGDNTEEVDFDDEREVFSDDIDE